MSGIDLPSQEVNTTTQTSDGYVLAINFYEDQGQFGLQLTGEGPDEGDDAYDLYADIDGGQALYMFGVEPTEFTQLVDFSTCLLNRLGEMSYHEVSAALSLENYDSSESTPLNSEA